MAWTASYQILRDRPLDDAELAAIEELATRVNQPAWDGESFALVVTRATRSDRVVGEGKQTLASDTGVSVQRMCDLLNALAAALPRVEVRVRDDVGALGIDPIAGRVRLGGGQGLALVDVQRDERQWKSPSEWLTKFRALTPALAAFAAGGTPPSGETLRAALVEIAKLPDDRPARAALLTRLREVPALELAQAGLDVYADIARARTTWALVRSALETIFDVRPLVERFLAIWGAPRGIYWYSDLRLPDHMLDALASVPAVEAQMTADLAASLGGSDSELVHRRGEYAAQMLGRARTAPALATLLEAASALHGQPLSTGVKHHTHPGVVVGLTLAAVPAVVPALLLEVGTATRWSRHVREALARLARLAPARASPLAVYLADAGETPSELAPVLQQLADTAAIGALERMAGAPDPDDRARAVASLRALNAPAPATTDLPAPARLVAHPSASVRERALGLLDEAGEPAAMASFLAASALDQAVRRRFDDNLRGATWKTLDRLPRELRASPLAAQLAWVRGDGAAALPAQVTWPEIAKALDGDVAAIAATYPAPLPHLDGATEAALRAEHEQIEVAVRHGDVARLRAVDLLTPVGLVDASPALQAPPAPAPPAPASAPPASAPPAPAPPPLAPPPLAPPPSAPPAPAPPPLAPPAPAPPVATLTSALAAAAAAIARPKFIDQVETVIDPHEAKLIDELLTVLAREQPVSVALAARAGLAPAVATMERWDRAKAVRARLLELGTARVGAQLLERLAELHDGSNLQTLCEATLPAIASAPTVGARLARLWDDAHGRPWTAPHRVTDYLEPVSDVPELFAAVLDELAAPDDGAQRGRTISAFALVGAAKEHRAQATAAVVARLRADRGRPRDVVGWRGEAYKALRKLGSPDGVATAILELAELSSPGKRPAELLELVARAGRELITQAIDLPELAGDATRELCRAAPDARERLLADPFWKIRLVAAEANRDWKVGKAEVAAVWAVVDAAGLAVPTAERKATRAEPVVEPIGLPPLPPAREGLAARCADYRTWALWAVDEAADPADAVARVFADELDRALVGLGHGRVAPRWSRWRDQVPTLPTDRRARVTWARERRDAALPALLARVRDEGAAIVAAELPRPYLTLTAAQRAELVHLEDPIAQRGLALFQ